MNRPITKIVLTLLVICATSGEAQVPETNNRYRLAQSYEQGGDFENAAKLYRELYTADPSNYMIFDGLRRSLLQLKRHDEAIALISQRLGMNSQDVNLLCLLGSAYYQNGSEKEANASWERAIAADPANANVYRLVANTMLENRLLDKATEVYRRARKGCNDPNLFTLDLAQLLAVTMDYTGATTEFLRFLKNTPTQLGYVQTRLAQFTGKEEARDAAIDVVRAATKQSNDIHLERLLGWLYLEGKRFDEAFGVYKLIDKVSNAQGVELYAFAERVHKEGAFAVAAEAYREAINAPLAAQRLPYAKFGYALTMKERSIRSDTVEYQSITGGSIPESQRNYTTAIDYFQKIISEYPNSEFAARSYFEIGTLQFSKYFDLDASLNSFQRVEHVLARNNTMLFDVAIKIGEVLTAKGDTSNAATRFRGVMAAGSATPDQQDEATYRLAELEYFGGRFADAIRNLESISLNLKANYANDALQLLAFLQENSLTAEAPLREFARADFLARQKKYTEAITMFQDVVGKNPQALFVDEGLMRIALLQTLASRYNDALATYQQLLTQFKDTSIKLDRAQFNIGELYDRQLKDRQKAIAAYEQLLAEHPQSLLTDQARKRIRELRGDSL